MKYVIVFFVLLSVTFISAEAQFTKGTYMIGGSFSEQAVTDYSKRGSSAKIKDETRNALIFTPQAGYFFTDHFAAGIGLSYLRNSWSNSGSAYNNFIVSPFVRYYFNQFFLQTTVVYQSSGSTIGFNTGLGYAILLNKNVSVEPQFGFTYTQFNHGHGDDYNSSGAYLKIAIQLYLHR